MKISASYAQNIAIQKELTQILYQNLSFGLLGISILSLILVWQLIDSIQGIYLIPWFVILNLNLLGGYGVIYWYNKTKDNPNLEKRHFYAYVVGSSITAIMLGIMGSLMMPDSIVHQVLIVLMIIGITGASVQNLHSSYLAACFYLSFSLLPLLLWEIVHVFKSPDIYLSIFVATLTFLIYLIVDIYAGYTMLLNNIKLKLENIHYANELGEQKELLHHYGTLVGRYQSCSSEENVYQVFKNFIDVHLNDFTIIYYSFNPAVDKLISVVSNEKQPITTQLVVSLEDCIAIKNHKLHFSRTSIICPHLKLINHNCICIPIMDAEQIMGLLTIILADRTPTTTERNIMYRLGGDLVLAISNIRLKEHLKDVSIHDALTNLYNRYYLEKSVINIIEKARADKIKLSFILFDIDYFKKVNDKYGHDRGDKILIQFARLLQHFFTETEYIFRYGGEEFLIILTNTNSEEAFKRAEEFRSYLKNFSKSSADTFITPLTISGGIATFPDDGHESDMLIKTADELLYKAKERGRDRIYSVQRLPHSEHIF